MQKGRACRQAGFTPIIILVGILVLGSVVELDPSIVSTQSIINTFLRELRVD